MTHPIGAHVIDRVKTRRAELRWSAKRLAQECANAGHPKITESLIANMEAGRRKSVSVDELVAFANALRVSWAWLLCGRPEETFATSWVAYYDDALQRVDQLRYDLARLRPPRDA